MSIVKLSRKSIRKIESDGFVAFLIAVYNYLSVYDLIFVNISRYMAKKRDIIRFSRKDITAKYANSHITTEFFSDKILDPLDRHQHELTTFDLLCTIIDSHTVFLIVIQALGIIPFPRQ
jgi:hypothetical protein